jgi:hypothetical protein
MELLTITARDDKLTE